MSSVNSYGGRSAFGTFRPNNSSSDTLRNKKAKSLFCAATSKCPPTKLVSNSTDLYLFRTYVANNQPPKYNTRNLNINLITTLNLENVTVIQNICTQTSPIPIDPPVGGEHVEFIAGSTDPSRFLEYHVPMAENVDDGRYALYAIDPYGELFGNTPCGLNNYVNYLRGT